MSELITVQAQGLLFDMDGVLISSIGSVIRSWRKWATHYGVPGAEEFVTPHGVTARDIIASVAPDADPDEGLALIEQIELDDMEDLRVLPGVRQLLAGLPKERWAIVTSATRRLLLGRLEHAKLPLPCVVVSADDVSRGKPDPEPYRKGAQAIQVPVAECIVIEDAPSGVRAGKDAGARVLAVLGTSDETDLRKAGADWVVGSLESVRALGSAEGLQMEFDALPGSV